MGKFNTPPYPPNKPMGGCSGGNCGHSALTRPQEPYTPPRMAVTDLPPLQGLATQGRAGVGREPGIIQNNMNGGFKTHNIKELARNLQREHEGGAPPQPYPRMPQQGPILEPIRSVRMMDGMADDVGCKAFSDHVASCKKCYKLYRRNHKQGALIIFLVFIIILLVIRLMDKQ